MTSLYTAIMQAADHIEQNPKQFDWWSTKVPSADCGTPACAVGWVGHYYGIYDFTQMKDQLRADGTPFYQAMDIASGDANWQEAPDRTVIALRAYAEKYHKPAAPDWTALASGTDLLGESSLAETQECVR